MDLGRKWKVEQEAAPGSSSRPGIGCEVRDGGMWQGSRAAQRGVERRRCLLRLLLSSSSAALSCVFVFIHLFTPHSSIYMFIASFGDIAVQIDLQAD